MNNISSTPHVYVRIQAQSSAYWMFTYSKWFILQLYSRIVWIHKVEIQLQKHEVYNSELWKRSAAFRAPSQRGQPVPSFLSWLTVASYLLGACVCPVCVCVVVGGTFPSSPMFGYRLLVSTGYEWDAAPRVNPESLTSASKSLEQPCNTDKDASGQGSHGRLTSLCLASVRRVSS